MPRRRFPAVGHEVIVSYLAVDVPGVIEDVDESRRELTVVTEDGELLTFKLDAATATFISGPHGVAARLRFP